MKCLVPLKTRYLSMLLSKKMRVYREAVEDMVSSQISDLSYLLLKVNQLTD